MVNPSTMQTRLADFVVTWHHPFFGSLSSTAARVGQFMLHSNLTVNTKVDLSAAQS